MWSSEESWNLGGCDEADHLCSCMCCALCSWGSVQGMLKRHCQAPGLLYFLLDSTDVVLSDVEVL
jgi:hypothetical protein